MPEFSLTVDLKLSVVVDAEDDSKLARIVTDEIGSALLKEAGFVRVTVLPGSSIYLEDGTPLKSGNGASATASRPAPPPPPPPPKPEPEKVLGRDLEVTPVPGGMYEFALPGVGTVCRAPSNHPDWMNAIAAAFNAGRKSG